MTIPCKPNRSAISHDVGKEKPMFSAYFFLIAAFLAGFSAFLA